MRGARHLVVPGHALEGDGRAWLSPHCDRGRCATFWLGTAPRPLNPGGERRGGGGHAHCECGWMSEHLRFGRARRRAHRSHKLQVVQTRPVDATGAVGTP